MSLETPLWTTELAVINWYQQYFQKQKTHPAHHQKNKEFWVKFKSVGEWKHGTFFLGLTDFRGTSLRQNRDSSSTRKFTNTDSGNSSLTKLTTFHWHFWRQFIHADERITVFEYEYEVICFHCQLPANPLEHSVMDPWQERKPLRGQNERTTAWDRRWGKGGRGWEQK